MSERDEAALQRVSIVGEDVKTADPENLLDAYYGLLASLAARYERIIRNSGAMDRDDLLQEGRLALLDAQKSYSLEKGCSFASWASLAIRNRMLRVVGYKSDGTFKQEAELLLDGPAGGDDTETPLIDMIPDPSIEDNDSKIIRDEQAEELRRAVCRIRNNDQRDVINCLYFEELSRAETAQRKGITISRVDKQREAAIKSLRKDWRLKKYYFKYQYSGTLSRFKYDGESSVEKAVLAMEQAYDRIFGSGAYADMIRKQGAENHD